MKLFLFIQIAAFSMFSCTVHTQADKHSDISSIKNHLKNITGTCEYRNYQNISALNEAAKYIYNELLKYCDTVYYQEFAVNGIVYKNVIGSIGIENKERIIAGAHYDVAGNQEGADDNASGVAGILELAKLLSNQKQNYRIDIVAYTLEEPPYFGTEHMGSYIHAKSLFDSGVAVKGMICLEMIGYFSDEKKSQSYPLPHKIVVYGSRANYIMIVQKFGNGSFGDEIKKLLKNANLIDTKSIKAPSNLAGIDFSDHRNYWHFGYSAVMITNTAFYRNSNYHKESDTMETLDLKKMSAVIDEVYYAISNIK